VSKTVDQFVLRCDPLCRKKSLHLRGEAGGVSDAASDFDSDSPESEERESLSVSSKAL